MKYLLDTHIFIWLMEASKSLKKSHKEILENPQNTLVLSLVSLWEMVIKEKTGKFKLPKNWKEDIKKTQFELLAVDLEHIAALQNIPLHHRDPFDRMLIAQAKVENLTLITADPKMKKYKVPLLFN